MTSPFSSSSDTPSSERPFTPAAPAEAKKATVAGATPTATSLSFFKRPPSPSVLRGLKKRKAKVMDEDEYVEKVSDIIKRDFFPELEKMQARADYIDAKDRNDTATMRRLQERFSSGRMTGETRLASPATFETPEEVNRQQEGLGVPDPADEAAAAAAAAEEQKAAAAVSLDQFLAGHTSEDNESFREIQEEQFTKFRVDHAWMFKDDEAKSIEMKSDSLRLPAIEDQANRETDEKAISQAVDGWTYKNVNAVFYNPDGADFTLEELYERKSKERQIVLENTRFKSNPWKGELQQTSVQQTANSKIVKDAQKVGVDGKALAERPATPAVNGFKFLRMTPSPMMSSSESPLMTWGEVESTPYRLEGCETPLPMNTTGCGPTFSIQGVPKRDRIAHELAEKNSRFYRDRKGKAIQKARSNIRTPKGSLTERVASMSPAALRLATSKLGIRLGTDKSLRSSYTPSPSVRRNKMTPTPSSSASVRTKIGDSIRSATPKTPAVPQSPKIDPASMTDDLLKLPSAAAAVPPASTSSSGASRQRAADFM